MRASPALNFARSDLGGKSIEVLLTPGHTPDSICLLDRAQRTLYTGDTYYPGTLWLWAPETDLDAYQRSTARLTGLVPQVDTLRPAHGFLEADPAMLTRVALAMTEIRIGKLPFTLHGEKRLYHANGVSVLLAGPASDVKAK